jgi:tRNA(fMet)-specific endonuclease VapC
MSFLIDTDICSAYLKNNRRVVSQVMLHFGSLSISVITLGELLAWGLRARAPRTRLQSVLDFLTTVNVLDVTRPVAETFGVIRANLLDRGLVVDPTDMFNAATAIVNNLTLVSHNVVDYSHVVGLTLVDWMVP